MRACWWAQGLTIAIPSWRSIFTSLSSIGSGFSALPSLELDSYLPPSPARDVTRLAVPRARGDDREHAPDLQTAQACGREPRRQQERPHHDLPDADEAPKLSTQPQRSRGQAPRKHSLKEMRPSFFTDFARDVGHVTDLFLFVKVKFHLPVRVNNTESISSEFHVTKNKTTCLWLSDGPPEP